MPVYCVRVNNWTRHGTLRYRPELTGVTTSFQTAEEAIDWTLRDTYGMRIRDVEVDRLSDRDDCWFTSGPEEYQ